MKNPFGKNKQNKSQSAENNKSEVSAASELFGKLTGFFSTEPQKEKVLRHEDFNGAGDTYYATVSAGYKISQRIIAIILVIFLSFSLATNFKEITYDNFFFLMKDFSAAASASEANVYDTVSYDSNTRHFFSLYKGGLAVANPSNITVFTATGRKTLQISSSFSSPCIASSRKHFIIYDTAGNTFSVYNSFARVYKETLDYPVTGAAFAENGAMAIITKDISHKSLVHVYNKNYKRTFTVPSDKYAFSVAMNSEYDRLAISYFDIGNGGGRTNIVLRKLTDMSALHEIHIDGEFLLDCGFLSDERFAVVTDRAVRVYDKYFDELDAYEYGNGTVSGFGISEHGVVASYTLNSKNIVIAFDKSGNLLYNENVSDNIKDIGVFENYLFLRTDSGVLRINTKNDDEKFLTSSQGKMLIYSADTALICGDSKAEYVVFED